MRKEHFKNLIGNFPKVTDKPIPKIINCQLDIQLGQIRKEELNVVLIKIQNRKAEASTKYLQKYGRQGNLITYFFNFATSYMNKMQSRNGQNDASCPSVRKVTLESPRTTET